MVILISGSILSYNFYIIPHWEQNWRFKILDQVCFFLFDGIFLNFGEPEFSVVIFPF